MKTIFFSIFNSHMCILYDCMCVDVAFIDIIFWSFLSISFKNKMRSLIFFPKAKVYYTFSFLANQMPLIYEKDIKSSKGLI